MSSPTPPSRAEAEGFNTMLKQYQHWIEAPVDAIVLGLYHLQTYYNNEIQRGLSGLGTYSLRPEFISLQRPQDEVIALKAFSPEEIVQRIRNEVTTKSVNSEEEMPNIDLDAETDSTNFNVDHGTTKYSRARYASILYSLIF